MRAPLLLPLLQACLVDPSAWEDRRAELACSTRWFVDDDGDGFGGADAGTACRAPAGAVERSGDCDDAQTGVHPDAEETPGDGVDQDCDGGELCFEDGDGDGFGQTGTAAGGLACDAPGQSARSGDCDDRSQAVSPDASEIPCNAVDDDCDPATGDVQDEVPGDGVDEDCDNAESCFEDLDEDGYGSSVTLASLDLGCGLAGLSSAGGDCDDADPVLNPGNPEVCNHVDDDCDRLVDDSDPDVDPAGFQYVVADYDHDGFGNATESTMACWSPPLDNRLDCDDQDPLATVDQDWMTDADGDLAGAGDPQVHQCLDPGGGLAPERNGVDCAPSDPDIFPLQLEDCADRVDQDCDELVDCDDPDCSDVVDCLPACADHVWDPPSLPSNQTGSTIGAGNDLQGSCGGFAAPDVVFWFTPPVSGRISFAVVSPTYDTVLYAFDRCGGRVLACNDDAVLLQSAITVDNLVAGVPILVVVDGWNTQQGTFTLRAQ